MPAASNKKRRLQLAAVLLASLIFVGTGNRKCLAMSDEVRSMCQQAEQLINSQRFNDAIALLQRAGSMDPSCAEVHGYLGMAYQNSGKTRQAVPEYQQALQLNPQMSFLNVNLGTCYMNLNQLDQAVPYFQQYLQQNPNAPDAAQVSAYIQQAGSRKGEQGLRATMDQGQAFLNQHRYPDAIRMFQQAVSAQPNWAPGHFYLGYAMEQSGNHQGAITQFQSALQLDPNMKEAVLDIGSSYQSMGDSSSAVAWYERYLQENPGSPKAGDIRKRINGLRENASKQHQPLHPVSAYPQPVQPASAQPAYSQSTYPPAAGAPAGMSPANGVPPTSDPYEGLVLPQQQSMAPPSSSAAAASTPYGAASQPSTSTWGAPAQAPAAISSAPVDDYLAEATVNNKSFRWPADKMPIRMFVTSGAGDPTYRPSFARVFNEALTAWSQASNNTIAFWTVPDASQADIVCEWTGDPAKMQEGRKSGEGGVARVSGQAQSNGFDVKITRAQIILFTIGPGGATISDDDMKKVCLHEIGHALGLTGHSANNHDVMFYSESTSVWPSLTKRDKATICKLYAGYPTLVGAQSH